MKKFMDEDFLLTNDTAKKLYRNYAREMPVLDYHNHLSPREIFQRKKFANLTELWLAHDHYRWSAMRLCGVDEDNITGRASDYEKFCALAEIMPLLIGHPVYYWTHLELKRFFNIEKQLCPETAREIWDKTEDLLQSEGFDAVSLLEKMNVRALCTTDDPADSLEWHIKCKSDPSMPFAVYPSFRPDRFLGIDKPAWHAAIRQAGVNTFGELTAYLTASLERFCDLGCRSSDHGLTVFRYASGDADDVMRRALDREPLSETDISIFQGQLLRELAAAYRKKSIVMQLHMGAQRNNSPKLFSLLGADAGGDSVGQAVNICGLTAFLGDLERIDALPKTVLYSLNAGDTDELATLALTFASGGAKVRVGAAWWFQDHKRGIEEQLDRLMPLGLLPGFPGMLTDSRSVTSFVRHEYFRRILCNKLGELAENGQYGGSIDDLGALVRRLSYGNTRLFFGFSE